MPQQLVFRPGPGQIAEEQADLIVKQPRRKAGRGEKVALPLFAQGKKGKATGPMGGQIGRLEADVFKALGGGKFHMEKPRVWHFMKDGKLVYVEADRGDFLASEAASWISGACLAVDGGTLRAAP